MSSAPPSPLAPLPPSVRADLLYRAARFELDGRLWQAALGIGGETPATPIAERPSSGLLRLDTLIEALAADDRLQPVLTPEPVTLPPADQPTGPLALGSNQALAPALERAAARTGLDPAMLASIIDAEAARRRDGSWDPASRNPRSSAAGLGQFLSGTWIDEARRPGSWLHGIADAQGWLARDGSVRAEARPALLALRTDPAASIEAIADHAAANLRRLGARGFALAGRAETARAAYLAHHLGLGDAMRYLGGGLGDDRAGRLLAAQVGEAAAERRIAAAGSASGAHRQWLDHYVDQRIRPARFLAA
ncbi:peptidoglycan-binding protein [Sphingomonas glaciei]|uniref:Peptidoglycan-binding protein n=1 Tax=Sphingomonas glaciei TaxID=2938948 RepID=A0ABY5MQX6_9SPHN|nr:peptidoglycan-binding protein [Sphingomonas glaciei]UUR06898.1 peptidoglycan-binding protein [Sphingomonas glaciei]